MARVYRVNTLHGTTVYTNTAREADHVTPPGEGPESVEHLDAAVECNRLADDVLDAERTINRLRGLLEDLCEICPADTLETTEAGRRAMKFITGNPLPAATSGERGGPQSYGV